MSFFQSAQVYDCALHVVLDDVSHRKILATALLPYPAVQVSKSGTRETSRINDNVAAD